MTRLWPATGIALAIMGLAGCGGDPAYSESKACGVDAGLVESAVGTDSFTVSEPRELLPIGADVTSWSCSVSVDEEKVLTVDARVPDPGTIETQTQVIEESPEKFELSSGIGRVGQDSAEFGNVVCGDVLLTLRADGGEPEEGAVQALLEGVAEVACS